MPTILVQNLRGYPRRSRAIGRDVLQTARFGDSSRHSRPHNAITLRSQTIVCGTEFISWVLPSMLEQNLRGYPRRSRAFNSCFVIEKAGHITKSVQIRLDSTTGATKHLLISPLSVLPYRTARDRAASVGTAGARSFTRQCPH